MLDNIIDHVSLKSGFVALAAVYTLFILTKWMNNERKIRQLGGHAPRIKTFLPFDIDMVAKAVTSTMKHKNLEVWQGWFRSRGQYTVEGCPGGLRCIFTADPENIKAVLATQFGDYGKGKPFHEDWKDFLGDSIFTTDLQQWHDSRHLIRPQFIKDRVSDLETFEKHAQILMKAIANGGVDSAVRVAKDNVGQGREVDVSDLFFRYTLDAATDFLLGRSVNSLEVENQDFAVAFSEVQRVQNIIARAGPLNALVPRKSFFAGIKIINEFVNPYIEQALRLSPEELESKTKSEAGYTFLHALAGYTRDRKILRDQLVAVLLAGRDTTASTLSWTFYELGRHPEVLQKLRAEIIEHVGLDRAPSYNDLKSMKYLQNAMNETLRLYPVVPFNVRLALHDTTLPRGGGPDGMSPIGILKDTPVGYTTLGMQRRPDIYPASWSTDPALGALNYNPSRWNNWQPKPWTYIPFNGGPRICIGQQFALTEMSYTIVRLLQRFDRIVPLGEGGRMGRAMGNKWAGEPVLKAEIVLQPGMGVWMGFYERGVGQGKSKTSEKGSLVDV